MAREPAGGGGRAKGCRRTFAVGLAAAALPALLAACATSPTANRDALPAAVSVGDNLLGEACRLQRAPDEVVKGSAASAYDIFCGTWEEPSGQVFRAADGRAPVDIAKTGWWRERLDGFLTCQPPQPTTVGFAGAAASLDCALKRGSWAYQGLVVTVDGEAFLADGIPAAMPAVERAIGVLAGRIAPQNATQTGAQSAEIARLEARIAKAKYSMGDLQVYFDLLRLAQYHNFQGDHAQAERRYREALATLQTAATVDNDGLAFVLMHLALELSNQERFNEANGLFVRAEAAVAGALDPTLQSRLISYRALHFANQRAFDQAATLAQQASQQRLELTRSDGADAFSLPVAGGGGRLQASGNVLSTLGDSVAYGDVVQSKFTEAAMLIRADQPDEAAKVLSEGIIVFEASPDVPRRWLPEMRWLQAEIAERRGDLAAAERLLRDGIEEQARLSFAARGEINAWLQLGRLIAQQGRTDEALAAYRTGFELTRKRDDGLRFDAVAPFFSLVLSEAKRQPERQQALFGEAFEVVQLVRGSVTEQTIALTTARLASADEDASRLIRELQDARARRDQLIETLTRATANPAVLPTQLLELEARLAETNGRIGELERAVQAAAPRYGQLVDRSVSLRDVTQALAADEAIFNILVGPKNAIAFFIDRQGIVAYEVALSERDARRMVARLREPFGKDYGGPFDRAEAFRLYKALFAPIEDRLAAARHLITVPSGPLLSLPFALLLTREPAAGAAGDYGQLPWFARSHPLTLAPSVQSFVNLRQSSSPSQARQSMIGFGDFVPGGDAEALMASRGLPPICRPEVEAVADAPRLPGTAGELRAVARTLAAGDGSLILGPAFTEQAVLAAPLEEYRVVYFATHGILPYQLGCFAEPALLTSRRGGGAAAVDDGLLTTSEIITLKMDADLVVLSACNTGGAGERTGGESLSGLARAFFYAGARSLMVTHWEIADEPTVRLMTATFDGLVRRNLTLAEALQAGQLLLLQAPETAHPVNWAAFTLVGDGGRRLQTLRLAAAP
ncbi:MAG: CHAT domain-containing protein [Rhodospirillales bacterium]|nr:CHAT domain-containing protein [Rhodospirillales bacterium]